MSTGYRCEFREVLPGQWWYILQDWDCPVGADDWRTYATAYGPFAGEDAALAHLDRYQANPGGWNTYPHPATHVHPQEWVSNGGTWDALTTAMIPFQSCSCGLYRRAGRPWPTVAADTFVGGADVARLIERAATAEPRRRRAILDWR